VNNKKFASSLPVLPVLPSLRGSSNGSRALLECLCGCQRLTGNRFVSGHDAKLQKAARLIEQGYDSSLLGCHEVPASVEVLLRAEEGVTGSSHGPIYLTREKLAAVIADSAKPKSVRRSRKAVEPVAAPVADVVVVE